MIKTSFHTAFLISLLTTISFVACQDTFVYKERKEIPNNSWAYSDSLEYRISVTDTSALYNLYAEFEYADTFPVQ
ncbi:MAG: hypothetical protein ACK5CH_04785, partial [Bacteroidota bacterium]